MDNFNIIYKILKTIEQSMDYEEFDINSISAEYLGISQARWEAIMYALVEAEYITGVELVSMLGRRTPGIKLVSPRLTIDGLEYLENNTMMKKAYRLMKGIKDIIPGA